MPDLHGRRIVSSEGPQQDLEAIVYNLRVRLGRMPTDSEVYKFVFGTELERKQVWNNIHDIKYA
jgi:hypothetical protein